MINKKEKIWEMQEEKLQRPNTCLHPLGVDLDTIEGSISIPDRKRKRYLHDIQNLFTDEGDIHGPRTTTIPRLRSVLGKLVYVSNIIYAGRTRLYHMLRER